MIGIGSFRRFLALAVTWLTLGAATSEAVLITETADGPNRVAPADDPGWSNIATWGNGTAVYVGQGWMVTADHLTGGSSVRFTDGRAFDVSVASEVRFTTGTSTSLRPDLRMFRIIGDPDLPNLSIADAAPAANSQVMMIGAGRSRESALAGFSIDANSIWTQVPLPQADALAYVLTTDVPAVMRWGVNRVQSNNGFNGSTITFSTVFSRPAPAFEAQAVIGDSGGGVFAKSDGDWSLTGIMVGQQTVLGHPQSLAAFGDQTISVELSDYRSQILAALELSPWKNELNPLDVNRSGGTSPSDLLVIVNELLKSGAHPLVGAPAAGEFLLDVNGDRKFGTLDLLQFVNSIAADLNPTAPPAPPTTHVGVLNVPEPSGAALGVAGLLALAVARYFLGRFMAT